MADIGHDFKAPKKKDIAQWKKVERLFEAGFTFHSCGCGPGYRPADLREVESFIQSRQQLSEAELLLKRFADRKAS